MSAIKLIVDDRERVVIDELKRIDSEVSSSSSSVPDEQWWYVKRLAHGDYAFICEHNGATATFMIIERKTYSDFAQSIKDSRIDNMARLIALRDEISTHSLPNSPALRIAILLEGPRLDNDDKIDGIPIKCIRAKIDHMWLRDNIYLIEVPSARETAQYLRSIVVNAKSLHKKSPDIFNVAPIANADGAANVASEAQATLGGDQAPADSRIQSVAMRVIAPPTISDNVKAMFAQFPGVGKVMAKQFTQSGISIAEFVRGNASDGTDSKGMDSKGMDSKGIRLSERYRAERTIDMDVDIIAQMHGVSKDMSKNGVFAPRYRAEETSAPSISALCGLSRDELSCSIKWRGRIMKKVGQNLYDCLHYAQVCQ